MPLDLDAIKARLSVITPGAWYQGTYPDGDPIDGPTGEYRLGSNILCEGEEIARADSTHDADLIAHAPTDIAALVAEIERLRATMTQIAEEFRGDLWVNDDDFRGHEYYERILDALADGEVSGG